MSDLESIPQPLEIQLCRTQRCAELFNSICEFENSVFGPDFTYSAASLRSWYDSRCMFSAAMCGTAVAGRPRILALVSAFLTDEASRDRLVRGEITDSDLRPWSQCQAWGKPSIYFASVVSDNPRQLTNLYQSVEDDMAGYLDHHGLTPESAFSVASGEPGFRHMERNGFKAFPDTLYLGRYAIMTLDLVSARTAFWKRLLSPPEARATLQSFGSHGISSASRADLVLSAAAEDAHEVERRLARSKADRYRKGLSY